MAKTYNQIKNSVLGKKYDINKNSEKTEKTYDEIKSGVKNGKYNFNLVKSELEKTIQFDTFSTDLSSMGKTIEDVYNGWQTPETMQNTRSSMESMQARLKAYKEYQRLFGKNELPEITASYTPILDGWDALSKEYGKYTNADAYTTEKNTLTELYSMNSEQLKGKKGVAYTTADGYNIKWEDLYNDAYSREYEADIDNTVDVAKSGKYKKKDAKLSTTWNGYAVIGDEDAYLYNYVNGDKEARDYGTLTNVHLSGTYDFLKNKHLTEDEKKRFNAIWETQGPEKAKEYLGLLDSDLRQRRVEYERQQTEAIAKESPIGSSVVSVLDNLGNNMLALPLMGIDYAEDGSIDENSSLYTGRRRVQTTRATVENDVIDSDVGKFFYRHGMNAADNVAAQAMGGFGTLGPISKAITLGSQISGAGVDAVIDAKERGLSEGQALSLGGIAMAAEYFFESKTYDALFDKGNLTRNGWKYFTKNILTEVVGENLTEGVNDIADHFIAQDLSKLNTELKSYQASGMSEKDAFNKVIGGVLSRYADITAGTIFSTGVTAGPGAAIGSYNQHRYNKAMGQNIKANERVGDLFDIANNPEIASAYDTYTRYANKGITPENISDAKLGRLYSMAKTDAVDTLGSKKSTAEQKESALKTLARLSTVETENTVKKAAKEYNVGEETRVTESGVELDVKDLNVKVKGDEVTVTTENGEISIDDVTLTQKDAELVVLAKGIAKTDGQDVANLFISQYDGKTDAEAYANAFNLTMAYAKNNFTYDTILNKKGVLTTEQVKSIYEETRIKADKAKAEAIKKLNKEMADKGFYKGFIDESVIDYENTSAEGKVNWNDLDARQKQAITFIKGFAQATGMNLKLISDGLERGINGSYDVKNNTITLDIYAGIDHVKNLSDTIIPTMSHETTHWMKEKSPELWRNLNEIVFSTLTEHYNLNTEQSIKDKIALLNRLNPRINHTEEDAKGKVITEADLIQAEMNRKGYSEDVAREEIIARACEDMLKMSEQGKKIFNSLSESEQKTLYEKIKALITDLINWVNDLLNSYESTSTEARIMREYQDELKKASKVWDEMLKKSVEANQSLEKSGAYEHTNTTDSDVLHSIREEYVNEIEEWKKEGMPKGETFILGITGDVLQGLGAIESDIYMLGDKIKYILNTHPEMTIEEIKKIPQILENPILILKSRNVGREKSSNTRLVIFGNVKAQDGKPILSVLDLRPTEKNLVVDDMQKVSSAYTKDVMPVDFVRNSLVVYADKKRTTKLLRTIGFKIPIELQQSGYIGNITYIGQNVNINGEEFSKVFKDKDIRFSDRDTEYLELAKNPEKNEARLREMVYQAAKEAGYTDDSSWRMGHTAPNSQDDVSLDNLKESGLVPNDFWEHPEWYTHSAEERESYYKVKHALERQERYTAEGKPNEAKIWVYRAVDKTKNKKEDYFRNGDWVTPSYDYAVNEGKMNPNGYRIIKHSVSIKHLYWDGNSIAELGYDDGNNYAYADTLNNRKLLDIVTYDYDGNIIPLSKRFKRRNWDVRYSERDTSYIEAVEKGDVETASRLIEEAAERVFSNSKVRGSDGKLRLVYHGTVNDFTVFDRQFSNIEGDFGKGYYFTSNEYDVDANYANEEGPDLKNKIARLAERLEWEDEYSDLSYEEREEIARQRLVTSEPTTITAYLNMENPVYITPDEKGTFLDYNEEYDEKNDEYGEPEGLLLDFIEALKNNSYDYAYNDVDFSFLYEYAYDGGMYASDAVKIIKERILDELTDENGDLAINEVIRLAFEEIGFDGIIDTSVYYKFNNMSGMDSGTTHYIVFDSNQIKSADIATYDNNGNVIPLSQRFNLENEDIRYSDRDYVAYDSTAILKESTIDLYLRDYASESSPNYAQAYITYMSPSQFLRLTTSNEEGKYRIEKESKKFEREKFEKATHWQPIQLRIDHKSGEVLGHEGRHRMVALENEGIYDVPVLLFDSSNKLDKENLNDFTLTGQFNEYRIAIIDEAIPFNYENRDLIIEKFGTQSSTQKVGERLGIRETLRYSEREDTSVYDTMGETERIKKENEKFKAEVERLKERLKIERKVTNGNYFNENQLGAVAGHLRNISKSLIAKDKLVDSLKDVYSFIVHSPNLTWEEVFERCYNVADAMLAEAKPVTMVDDYSKYLLREIRNTRISLDETQKKEAQYHFGKNWNRHFMGKVIIANDAINIDAKWQEWSNMYPDIFDADTNSGDMIGELYDIIDSLKEASETIDEYGTEEQKRWLAKEIYNQYWNVSPIRTTADKYDKQIRLLNFEHRRIMTEFREDYNTRLKEQHKAAKEKQKKLIAEIRERKDKEIALAKQHGKERLDKYKENAERKTRIQSITSNSLSLNEMLVKNSKDKHVPEIMREPVTALLQAIDFSSKRMLENGEPTRKDISLSKALSKVKDMMVKATNAHNELVELYGHGLDEDIEKMVDSVDDIMRTVGDNEFILNKMTLTDLQTLDKMVKTIRHAVNKLNKFHTVNHARGIANLSQESILYLDSLGKGKIYDGKRGAAKKLLDWGNALPYYVFKRFGSGGMKVYEALQDGWDKFVFNTKKILDYVNEAYTSKEVNEWSEEIKTFKILIPATEYDLAREDYVPQYQEVQLTVPQIMSMYCLNKREQARGHLFKGGIRVADFKDKKGKIVSQSEGVVFTEKDISTILNSLTDRQKAVADKLQEFMNTVCADWGNDVSMARFGYKAFGEENYFPIQSDKNNLAVNDETEQPNSLFKLLNMSFTKSTIENANNRIVISDIFDVFAQHTSDMAKYNALALPVLDSFKWYNYTEKQDIAEGTFKTSGVKQSIERAFGKDGQNYFTTFLKDINGQQEVSRDTLGKGFFSNAKIAAVGANLRVVLLQPTSYVRASAIIDNKYLSKALIHKPKVKKAETHCGIALWKSMGYYDTNIQKGLEAQIKHADTWKDKVTDWSMKGAEIADKVTWGYLWNACELEVRDKRKDLKVGSQEFYDAISKRLREVIYATQVVDSTMTRSQMMRSSDGRDKLLTAFASEPTLAYNMLQDAYMGYTLDARRMGKAEAIKKNGKRIARILTAYTMTNAVAALVESAFDALRDDDDEEMDMALFMKYYFSNFASDMSITAKIPLIKEFHSFIQGFSSSRTDTQWMENITKAMTTWYKLSTEGKGKTSTAIKYSIKAISDLFGIPFYNVYRDTMATLNKLDLFTEEDLNEMFEDFIN